MGLNKDMFSSDALREAEEDFSKVKYEQDQRNIITSLSKILSNHVPVNQVAMRGFMAGAIQDWQQENSISIGDVASMSPQQRATNVKKMFLKLANRLVNILNTSDKEQAVRDGVKDAFNSYKKQFATR